MSRSTAAKKGSLRTYASLTGEIFKVNLMSAAEYRTAFLMKVFGMVINDFAWLGLWVIFFARFPQVNGWTVRDVMVLYAIGAANVGIVFALMGGAITIARKISRGEMDYFLTLPKNILWHISTSYTDIPAIGDVLFGILVLIFLVRPNAAEFGLFWLLTLITSITIYSFIVLTQSIGFYVQQFDDAAETMMWALIGFAMYPQVSFVGLLRVLTFTLIPAFFVSTLPVALLSGADLRYLIPLCAYAAALFAAAVFTFYHGLKRYESGNLISVKM